MATFTRKFEVNRRDFCKTLTAGGMALAVAPNLLAQQKETPKPKTNIDEALKHPRNRHSLPGKFPGKVVQALHGGAVRNGAFQEPVIEKMLSESLLHLTGAKDVRDAWREFVNPDEVIALKVNPVAGKSLSTSVELVRVMIRQLQAAGIPPKNLIIWDRREFQLHEAGFTPENFPGIRITGPECKDENGSFYDKNGRLYAEERIDKEWYFWADCEMEYDAETLPYMVNQGKYSYFSKVVTREADKIINIPILKNAGPTVTLCLKNLAYGSISNTARLHKPLWGETCAQVPCFPPIRDKVVLNIVDGIKGCYEGGPGAKPQFFTYYNTLLVGTDPVAVDRIGYDIVLKERLKQGVQEKESPRGTLYMEMAAGLGLGVADPAKIDHQMLRLG